jgi:two-component system CheB/CheR fusion protein
LRPGLAAALHKAVSTREPVRVTGLHVKTNGPMPASTSPSIRPARRRPIRWSRPDGPATDLYLVVLEEAPETDAAAAPGAAGTAGDAGLGAREAQARIQALTEELRAKDEYLQSTHEELESSNEELKSSNEEMQSVNEELQSTNEELETSKEELQSVNEELATVNTELHTKVTDLSRANNDMNNLLAGTGIATVFVDHQRRILRFTPTAAEIINLIPGDVGRPVGHLVANLVGYASLVGDVQAVLDTLVTREVELQTTAGKWYAMRIQPYRTLDNVIEGAVLTFMDISEMKRIQASLAAANRQLRLAVVVRDASDAITVQDLEGRITAWNPGAQRLYGWSEDEALQMNVRDRIPPALLDEALARVRQLSQAEVLEPYRTRRLTKAGAALEVSMTATALLDEAGQVYAIATTERPSGAAP